MEDEGVGKIISHIEAEADKEISETLLMAREMAHKVRRAAQERADREAGRILSDGKRAASLEGQRIIAEARIDARRKRMSAQEEAIAASFGGARRALEELAERGRQDHFVYQDVLFSLIASASEIVAGDRLEVVLNQRDRKAFDRSRLRELVGFVKKRTGRDLSLSLPDETIPCLGGVVVRDIEGHVEIDNTFETRLERLRQGIRVDVAKILFGDRL